MAAFPIVHPPSTDSGRLTEICSFRRSSIPITRFDEVFTSIQNIASKFPISRQNLIGSQSSNRQITVLVADWTSAAEKDEFEPGERYQSIKPAFGELVDAEDHQFACHHIILPAASKTTPEAGSYVFTFTPVSASNQSAFAAALSSHVSSVFSSSTKPIFYVAAPSREDANTVVGVWGFKTQDDASAYLNGEGLKEFKKSVEGLVEGGEKGFKEYKAELNRWKSVEEGGWKSEYY